MGHACCPPRGLCAAPAPADWVSFSKIEARGLREPANVQRGRQVLLLVILVERKQEGRRVTVLLGRRWRALL